MTINDKEKAILEDLEQTGLGIEHEDGGDIPYSSSQSHRAPIVRDEAIVSSPADPWIWEQVSQLSVLADALNGGEKRYERTKALAYDTFKYLFNLEPQLVEPDQIDKDYRIHAQIFQIAEIMQDVQETRIMTRLDDLSSALGVATLLPSLIDLLEKGGEGASGGREGDSKGEGGSSSSLSEEFARQIRMAIRKAIDEAQQQIQDVHDAEDAFGDKPVTGYGTEPGQRCMTGNVKQRAERAKQILENEFFRRLVRMAGRIRMIAASAQREIVQESKTEIFDTELGNDLHRVLLSSLSLLANPVTRLLFLKKYVERALPQFKLRGYAPVGRGPIVLTIDESGSMDGDPIAWAKAIFLAVRLIALEQKRDLLLIVYGSRGEIEEYEFPQGRGSTEYIMEACKHNYRGGTYYEEWMEKSLKAICSSKYERGDVIAITDGECSVTDDMQERWDTVKAEKKFKAMGILLGSSYSGGTLLATICDPVATLKRGETNATGSDKETLVLFQAFSI